MKQVTVTEREVQRQCLRYLSLVGVLAWRTNSGAMTLPNADGTVRRVRFTGARGCSDVIGVLPGGRFLALELKRQGGTMTPDQKAFLDLIRGAGGLALCVSDVRQLEEALKLEGVIPS